MVDARRVDGKVFQIVGPETAKLHCLQSPWDVLGRGLKDFLGLGLGILALVLSLPST